MGKWLGDGSPGGLAPTMFWAGGLPALRQGRLPRGGGGEAAVEVGEGVFECFDVVEFVHVLGVIDEAGGFQTVVEVGRRFAAVEGVALEQVDEEAEFLAHGELNPCGDRPNGGGRP